MTFAKSVQSVVSLEPVERHGRAPVIISCADEQEKIREIKRKIRNFENGGNASLGVILKTNRSAAQLYEILSADCNVSLITPESSSFQNGVTVTSIQMAKGLEFDEVILADADHENYRTEDDRSLLYIACTRAMHELTLLYSGKRTELVSSSFLQQPLVLV